MAKNRVLDLNVEGALTEPALARMLGAAGARAQLSVDQVERAVRLAAFAAEKLAPRTTADSPQVSVSVLPTNGMLEVLFNHLQPGTCSDIFDDLVAYVGESAVAACVSDGDHERLAVAYLQTYVGNPHQPDEVTIEFESGPPPTVTVEGELDINTAPHFGLVARSAIISGADRIVLDLSAVSFLDSSALRSLIGLAGLVGTKESIGVVGSHAVERALAVTGLDQVFCSYASAEEARAKLDPRSPTDIHSPQMPRPSEGPLQVTSEQSEDTYRVVAAGELDLSTSPGLEVALLGAFDSDKQQITVDLTGIDFLDSSGLKVIVEAARRDSTGRLSIAASDAVRRVIELSGLGDRLPVSS